MGMMYILCNNYILLAQLVLRKVSRLPTSREGLARETSLLHVYMYLLTHCSFVICRHAVLCTWLWCLGTLQVATGALGERGLMKEGRGERAVRGEEKQ